LESQLLQMRCHFVGLGWLKWEREAGEFCGSSRQESTSDNDLELPSVDPTEATLGKVIKGLRLERGWLKKRGIEKTWAGSGLTELQYPPLAAHIDFFPR